MTHRIVVNVETGVTTQVEYTPEEQAVYDATVAQQAVEAATALATALAAQQATETAAQPQTQP